MVATDKLFAGSIPEIYDRFLVPLIFEPYAVDLAGRVAALAPNDVIETAAGTGVLTRALAERLSPSTHIVATDLNQPMLDQAAKRQQGYKDARRVLRPGGRFLFNVWDDISANEFADVVTQALSGIFPDDPPRFLARTPHGHHDVERIRQDLKAAGFTDVAIDAGPFARS